MSAHERVIAAVGIAGPTLRFRGKELAQKVSLMTEIAARLAMGLGRLEGGPTLVAFDKSRETNGPKASGEV